MSIEMKAELEILTKNTVFLNKKKLCICIGG